LSGPFFTGFGSSPSLILGGNNMVYKFWKRGGKNFIQFSGKLHDLKKNLWRSSPLTAPPLLYKEKKPGLSYF
jgi:hypothetical protein